MAAAARDLNTEKIKALDPWAWATHGNLQVMGGPFLTAGYEYLVEPLRSTAQYVCQKKATQGGWTQINVIRALHRCKYRYYKQGVLYLFPTRGDVTDFSNSRFKPMITDNPIEIGAYVNETDQANLKKIDKAFLYFRGARMATKTEGGTKDAHTLKGIPADEIIFDEFDEMPKDADDLAEGRLENSPHKNKTYLANPTVPDWGIDAKYKKSDQRVWVIKCQKCGRYTCLELEFPNCLERLKDGRVIRLCSKCRDREIYPKDGFWVAQYPSKSKDMYGYWASHLMSVRTNLASLLEKYEDPGTNVTLFHNLKLGMAYIEAKNRLTVQEVLACCSADVMDVRHDGPCVMGVDVGDPWLNVLIGTIPYPGGLKVRHLAKVKGFEDAHDLGRRFSVKSAVFDMNPERRKVREFRAIAPYEVFGCEYQETQKGQFAWDEKNGVVSCNRTEILDASHNLVSKNTVGSSIGVGRLELPRESEVVRDFAKEMCNTARVLDANEDTGKSEYRYIPKLDGPDDWRHALNYLYLASQRIRPVSNVSVSSDIPVQEYKYD